MEATDLARALRQLRRREAQRRGGPMLTYRELAAKTGWSHSAIGLYLSGRVLPPVDRFDALIHLLGATPQEQKVLATARDEAEERRGPGHIGPRGAAPIPRQVPPAPPALAGREAALRSLDRMLHGGRPMLITGAAGVGKSALAAFWAHRAAARFPDGQLYVDLRGFAPTAEPVPAADALRGFLAALDVPAQRMPADLDGRAALLRSLAAGRRMLFLLDNAATAEQVRPLLTGSPTVITSRDRLAGLVAMDGADPLPLDLLDAVASRELLVLHLGAERVAAAGPAAEAILSRCAGLPLALSIVAARAAVAPGVPLAELDRELRDTGRLDTGDSASDVRAVFSWSYEKLSPPAARLFRLAGLHPGPELSAPLAASLSAAPPADAREALGELARTHLLREHGAGRYGAHDLLGAYARDLSATAEPAADRQAAYARMLDHYTHSARAAAQALTPHWPSAPLPRPAPGVVPERPVDPDAARAWFAAEQPHLLPLLEQAAEAGHHERVWQLVEAWGSYLDWSARWPEWLVALDAAVTSLGHASAPAPSATATEAPAGPGAADRHRVGEAALRCDRARALLRLGRREEAYAQLHRAIGLYASAGHRTGLARTYRNLGICLEEDGRYAEARDAVGAALEQSRAIGDLPGQANALNGIGWCHARLGDTVSAIESCTQALAYFTELGDRHGQASTLDTLGYVQHLSGDPTGAVTRYQAAIDRYRQLGVRLGEAESLEHLGDAYRAIGADADARAAWQAALAILDDLGDRHSGAVRAKLAA